MAGDFSKNAPVVFKALIVVCRAGPRRPADLTFEIGEKLIDAMRRRVGLLALRVQQHVLGVAIGDIDVERAADRQHERHETHEIGDIFAKKALPAKNISQ